MAAKDKAATPPVSGGVSGKPKRKHPGRVENLKSWKKGQCGNPGGKPSEYTKAIRAALPPDEFAEIVSSAARKGDSRVINALMDRHFPRPEVALKLEHSGPDGSPIQVAQVQVEYVDDDGSGDGA